MRRLAAFLAALFCGAWAGGCDHPANGVDAGQVNTDLSPADCPMEVEVYPPSRADTDPVVIHGTAHHLRRLAIREIVVGGETADTMSYDFATWQVSLTRAELRSLPRASTESEDPDGFTVALPLRITDITGKSCVALDSARQEIFIPAPGDGGAQTPPKDGGLDAGQPDVPRDAGAHDGGAGDAGPDA